MPTQSIESRLEELKSVAKKGGIKLTHQRSEIFRALAASADHPDVDTVFRAVRTRVPTVSLDTVYRTLWKLHDLGLVSTLGPESTGVRFDANLNPHHHFVCTRCGLVRDFESTELSTLPLPDTLKEFGSVDAAHVEVRGVCRPCQTSPKSPARGAENSLKSTHKGPSKV